MQLQLHMYIRLPKDIVYTETRGLFPTMSAPTSFLVGSVAMAAKIQMIHTVNIHKYVLHSKEMDQGTTSYAIMSSNTTSY